MAQLSIQQAFERAVRHQQAGEFPQAEGLYRNILFRQPAHAGATYYLGLAAFQQGQIEAAISLLRKAAALSPKLPEAHNNLGIALQAAGQIEEAIASYRRALALKPNYPNALYNLGSALQARGQLNEAIAAYRKAIALLPNYAEAHNNLGSALAANGELDAAITALRKAIALKPGDAQAHSNLGNVLKDKGQFDQAIAAHRQAIALQPQLAEAHNNLGNALCENDLLNEAIAAYRQAIALKPTFSQAYNNLGNALKGGKQIDEAIEAYGKAIALCPDYAEAHKNLGAALARKGQLDQGIASCRRAIALKPDYAEAYNDLGNILRDQGQFEDAIATFEKCVALAPNFAEARNNLGNALSGDGQPDAAIAAYQQAILLRPAYAQAYSNLGNVLKDNGQLDDAIAAYRQALAADPSFASADSNLIYTMHFHSGYSAEAIAIEHRRWNRQHAGPLWKFVQPILSNRGPDRRLRIGYVSPDFRAHVVGRNLLPLFREHDRGQFDITCYSQVLRPDAMTDQFRQHADRWHGIVGVSDERVAAQIREDQIDILVDLALHMAGNRLLVFARKPAPVQVTFAGYPGSTGLAAIDYRLSDPYLDPPDMDPARAEESPHSERTIRLAHSFWCYDPLECRGLSVGPLPAVRSGTITFGCLNNFCKINDGVLRLWAKVLTQVECSRLLILAHAGSHRERAVECLRAQGIDLARIEFASRRPHRQYLELYNRIDVGLDSFPYNGHTTTLDSFWMGVPVVTLVGQAAVSRAGWSQLSNLGLTELAAHSPEDFVKIAIELATDLPRLEQLRSTLRARMEASPLMDSPRFARNVEAAYRKMWRAWCEMAV